jgi:hypothetical protein
MFPKFIEECLDEEIPVGLKKENGRISFEIDGFYKSGTIKVYQDSEDSWTAHDRYGRVYTVDSFQELVGINFSWWQSSKERSSAWEQPDPRWIKALERFGYIKPVTRVTYEPVK